MNIRAKIYGGAEYADEPLLRAKRPKGAKAEELDSIEVPREARRNANDRSGDRHRLTDECAQITYQGRNLQVELVNLSGGGAMVAGPFKPLLWERVDLHLGDNGTIECAVRWIRDGRVGLEFAHETRLECKPDEMAKILRDVIARSFPDLEFGQPETPDADSAPETEIDETRAAPRHPMIWTGDLHHDYQTTPVRVRNISETGAMIESRSPVRVGAEPMLQLGENLMVSATVIWAVGDQVGLRFQSEFDMARLAETRPTLAPPTWTPPTYLTKSKASASPWDSHWNRLGIRQLQQELDGFLRH